MKEYLKRAFRYIIKGIPNKNIRVETFSVENSKLLMNRNIIVTGGSRGLGYYISKRLLESGAKILIIGRNQKSLEKVQEEFGENCYIYKMDLMDIDKYDDLFMYAKSSMGGIDGLVCNAGIWQDELTMLDVKENDFDNLFYNNLKSPYFLAQSFINSISAKNNNSLVFISSERGLQCDDLPYGLTKASINSLTKGLSMRFRKDKNLRVNAVAPGTMATSMTKIDPNGNLYASDKRMERYYLPQEVAEVVLFLISSLSQCISGEIIVCDDGEYNSTYF